MTQHPIAAFLTARYDEIEKRERGKFVIKSFARCKECGRNTSVTETWNCGEESQVRFEPCGHTMTPKEFMTAFGEPDPDEFVLADIAAKRRIVGLHARMTEDRPDPDEDGPHAVAAQLLLDMAADQMLRLLALPFAQCPDYQEGWKS